MILRNETEITKCWPPNSKTLVTIVCTTYDHEKYIEDAIKGFLIQETKFPFDIIIHDDASTDNTPDIIRKYEKLYPKLIRPIYQTENQYSKVVSIWVDIISPIARGKYIALCEGDDYWIEPLKLQMQVDFLEKNKEYGLAHGECNFYYEEEKRWVHRANKNLTNKNLFLNRQEIFKELIDSTYRIRTATVVFKKELLTRIKPNNITFKMGDTPLWLDLLQHADFKYFDKVFSVYRIIGESASRSKNFVKQKRFKLSMAEMRVYYSMKYGYSLNKKLKKRYNNALLAYKIFDNDYKELYPLIDPSAWQKIKLLALKCGFIRRLQIVLYRVVMFLHLKKRYFNNLYIRS